VFFGGWQAVAEAEIEAGCGVEGASEGFEESLDFVMGIMPVQRHDMNVHAGFAGERVKEMAHEIGFERADGFAAEFSTLDVVRSSAAIDSDVCERFVHWDGDIGGAADSAMVTESFANSLAKANADVFDRVVGIDAEITIDIDREVEQAVAAEESQEVIECADSSSNARLP